MRNSSPAAQPFYRLASALTAFALLIGASGCLKTRAQLRQEQGEDGPVESQGAAPRSPSYQMEEIKAELVRVNGKVEEIEHNQKEAAISTIRESVSKLERQMLEVEKTQMLIMDEVKALKDAATEKKTKAAESAAVKAKPKNALNHANALLEQKQFAEAAEAFQKIVSAGVGPKESAQAHYGLGLAQFQLKDYKKAIVSLSKVQELSPKSNKVPPSLLLIGRSFDKLSMKKEAQGFYQELVDKYPKSAEARKIKGKTGKAGG